jgi:cytochrome P450 PksS
MGYSISTSEFLTNPATQLAQMRDDAALVRTKIPLLGHVWITTTDAAARSVLKKTDLFVRDPKPVTGRGLDSTVWWLPTFMKPLLRNMLGVDGQDHKRLRGLVDQAFARHQVADMTPELTQISNGLLDGIDTRGPVDILSAYARPLPLMAICALLGIPAADRDRVAGWIAPISGPVNALTMLCALPGLRRLMTYFRADFAICRKTPRPGLISELVMARAAGDQLDDDELLAMVVTLFVAGHETTVHLITMTILAMITRPDARSVLHNTPEALPLLIEEVMRHDSPVMLAKPHFVTRNVAFEGVQLRKGDKVMPLLIGANRDPSRFTDPDDFQPKRQPNPHIGFGHGPHVCLGMQLARAEARIAITQLFARFPDTILGRPECPPSYTTRTGIHGLTDLRVLLR